MRVKMKTLSAGPEGVVPPGGIANVSPIEAKDLVSGGYAEYVDQPGKPETAVIDAPVETAARKAPRKRAPRKNYNRK